MLKRIVFGLVALFACTAATADPVPGKNYLVLRPPQEVDSPANKVDVVEFFWFRCPHCYHLEPVLEKWVSTLPKSVHFHRIPAVFNSEWEIDARIYYTLDAIGEIPRITGKLFDAIHQNGGESLHGKEYMKWVTGWLAKHGTDMAKYNAALHSFSVENDLKRAINATRSYGIDGVPAIAVQGRWLVNAEMAGSRDGMIKVADYLTKRAIKALPKK